MKSSINALLLVAGMLLGGFLLYFFVLDDGGSRQPARGAQVSAATSDEPDTGTESDQLQTPASARPAMEVQRSELKQPKTKLELAREERAKEKQAEEQGPKLFGTVLAESGFAIAGAEVKVSATGRAKNIFGMIVENFAKQATTDGAGNFEVPRSWITDDEVSVKVTARGFQVLEETRAPSLPEGRADLGVIRLQPAVVLGGLVLNAAGEALEGVDVLRTERDSDPNQLFFRNMGGANRLNRTTTDAEGRFELLHEEVGEYDLIVKHKDYPQQRYSGSTPEAGGEDLSILIRMDATASLSGRIEGFPKGMQRITVQASPAVRSPDEELRGIALFLPVADAKSPSAKVAADGSFEVTGLVPSKLYVLKAMQQQGFLAQVPCSDELEVLSGSQELTLTWEQAATLSFRVEDQVTGKPISGGSARFLWKDESSPMGDMPRQRKFKGGQVRLEELRPNPAPGKLQVVVHAPGYQETKLDEVLINKGEQLELPPMRLPQAALLRVQVLDASTGSPVRRAYVELSPVDSSDEDESFIEGRQSDGNTDKEGWVALESCMTETASLLVRKAGFGEYREAEVAVPRVGTREMTVQLTPGGTVEAFVVDRRGRPVKNSRVYAILANGDHRMEDTNSRGRARFKSLEPGTHRFRGTRHLESNQNVTFSVNRGDQYDEELDWTSVSVSSKQTSKTTLSVASASSLGGRITAGGVALKGASVRVLQQRESKAEMDSEFEVASSMDGAFSGTSTATKTDSKGVFSIAEVPVGRHVLYVVSQSGSVPHTFPVEVIEGNNYADLELPIASITGIVLDKDGDPISGAKLTARLVKGEGDSERSEELEMIRSVFGRIDQGSVTSDSKGRFTIPNVSPDAPLTVRVTGKGFVAGRTEELTVSAGQVLDGVQVELAQAGSIRVKLLNSQARFAMLSASYAGKEEDAPERRNGQGWARGGAGLIEGLAPGLWLVKLAESEQEGVLVEVHAGSQAVVNL